jgi:hypothetical protein
MNYPVIPRIAPMTAPKVSRRFYNALRLLGLWFLFVAAFKQYARFIKPSRVITLDGVNGGERRPYLTRWHLIPRNRWLNLYLHKFVHGDDERALHDHPWASASLILEGRYIEHTSEWFPAFENKQLGTYVLAMSDMFSPQDGRTYVEGSVTANSGLREGENRFDYTQEFHAGDFRKLPPTHMHMIELFGNNTEPCWTLFMTGSIVRRWGFACKDGWRDFKEYLQDNPSRPGSTLGCE